MSYNPFEPPKARLQETSGPPGSPFKSVALGLLVDIGGTIALSFLLTVAYTIGSLGAGKSLPDIQAELSQTSMNSWIYVVGMIGGSAMSVLGGYVCARISRRSDYRLGYVLAALSVGTSVVLSVGRDGLTKTVAFSVLTIGCVLLGVYLGIHSNGRPKA